MWNTGGIRWKIFETPRLFGQGITHLASAHAARARPSGLHMADQSPCSFFRTHYRFSLPVRRFKSLHHLLLGISPSARRILVISEVSKNDDIAERREYRLYVAHLMLRGHMRGPWCLTEEGSDEIARYLTAK
jgi:hypothetical protein